MVAGSCDLCSDGCNLCGVRRGGDLWGFEYRVLDDGTVEITKYNDWEAEKVDIPEKIDGKSVTSIGNEAFGIVY